MGSQEWDKKYSTEEYIYTKTPNRFVVEYCQDLKGKTAIDLAGGEGRNSIWLAKSGWQVENIDFSQVALDKFLKWAEEENVSNNAIATCQDGTEFKPALGTVDLGVIAYLHIPMGELTKSIRNLASVINQGGHLFGVWHSGENAAEFNGPKDKPNFADIETALSGTGMEILELTNREGQIQTREGLKPSVTLVLLARRVSA